MATLRRISAVFGLCGDHRFVFMKTTCVLGLLFVLSSGACRLRADTLHVALPDILGAYSTGMTRIAEFEIGGPIDSVINVSIQWSGILTSGLGHGDGVERPADEWFEWPTQISARMDADEPGFWYAYSGPFSGAFADTASFSAFLNPSWQSLLNGHGEVRVSLSPLIFIGGSMVTPPSGVINSAGLIMEVVMSPTSVGDGEIACRAVPCEFELSQNYPNPFNPSTEIDFAVPSRTGVSLEVFNILGRRVAILVDGPLDAGYHTAVWDASAVASGVYFYRLMAGEFVETKKMVLLK